MPVALRANSRLPRCWPSQTSPKKPLCCLMTTCLLARLSLVNTDLPSRPDLTPWLAGVLVLPSFRGKGYSRPLVRRVEEAAILSTTILWLYTWSAELVYVEVGRQRVGPSRDEARGIDVVLMKRNLSRS